MSEGNKVNDSIRYSADESPPHGLSAVLGIQIVVLILAGIALTPIIVLKAAGAEDQGADWVVFAALLVSGLATMLQARPIGPFAAAHPPLLEHRRGRHHAYSRDEFERCLGAYLSIAAQEDVTPTRTMYHVRRKP